MLEKEEELAHKLLKERLNFLVDANTVNRIDDKFCRRMGLHFAYSEVCFVTSWKASECLGFTLPRLGRSFSYAQVSGESDRVERSH